MLPNEANQVSSMWVGGAPATDYTLPCAHNSQVGSTPHTQTSVCVCLAKKTAQACCNE
jgi:hypothetical protein